MSDAFSEEPLDVREIIEPWDEPGDDLDITIDVKATPAVWPVFVFYAGAFVVIIAVQIVIVVGLMLWMLSQGNNLQNVVNDLPRRIMAPDWFFLLAGSSQLVIGAAALIAGAFARQPWGVSLGLRGGRVGVWKQAVLAVGCLAPGIGLIALLHLLSQVIPPDESVKLLYEQMTPTAALPFIAFIALAPGFCEELFFRGYMQRRLLQRWSPVWAIFVTSLLFGILHMMPLTVIFAFGLGIWFGIIAWRVDSIWPTVAGHALINGTINVFQVGEALGVLPEADAIPGMIGVGVVGTLCFLASIWILVRMPPAATSCATTP